MLFSLSETWYRCITTLVDCITVFITGEGGFCVCANVASSQSGIYPKMLYPCLTAVVLWLWGIGIYFGAGS